MLNRSNTSTDKGRLKREEAGKTTFVEARGMLGFLTKE
jgi:hypothetical protein